MTKKGNTFDLGKQAADLLATQLQARIENDWFGFLENTCWRCKKKDGKHTKRCLLAKAKETRLEKAHQKREEKRRAKIITMTVGEYEDAIANASEDYYD